MTLLNQFSWSRLRTSHKNGEHVVLLRTLLRYPSTLSKTFTLFK